MASQRSIRHDLHTPTEVAITKAMELVEGMGCDERLTEAVIKLEEARAKVSEVVDERLAESLS